ERLYCRESPARYARTRRAPHRRGPRRNLGAPVAEVPRPAMNYSSRLPKKRGRTIPRVGGLVDVFASNRELFGRFDAHLDAPARAAEQRDLNGAVGEQLRHGYSAVPSVRRLDHDRFLSAGG